MNRPQYAGKSIIQQLWDELDAWYKTCNDLQQMGQDVTNQLGVCRGLAIAIHKMSTPKFATVDDVVREEMRRFEIGE